MTIFLNFWTELTLDNDIDDDNENLEEDELAESERGLILFSNVAFRSRLSLRSNSKFWIADLRFDSPAFGLIILLIFVWDLAGRSDDKLVSFFIKKYISNH